MRRQPVCVPACSAAAKTCSICGKEQCAHLKGRIYQGKPCHKILQQITDAYEWSFVAVPAQVHAGVTKRYGSAEPESSAAIALQKQLAAQNYRLYESFGSHLGVAIDNIRLIARDQQYAVVQERTLMAQGLHDSIAQSLSFLNIQVQLLESGLKNDDKALVNDTVAQIRTGVQECYEDVRELLLNFRERLHKESFAAAIATAIERFEIQTKLKAQIISEGKEPNLTDKQQLQVIFIMQEALANVRKHSHATDVRIVIDSRSDFTLTVMDNCFGIDMELLKQRCKRHVGMNIMRERA